MSSPTCQAQEGWLGWSPGSPPSESGPGLGLVAFCYAPPDKRPLWREGRHALQGLLQLRSLLTEGCCGSISKPLPCVPVEHNVGLSADPLWSVADRRRQTSRPRLQPPSRDFRAPGIFTRQARDVLPSTNGTRSDNPSEMTGQPVFCPTLSAKGKGLKIGMAYIWNFLGREKANGGGCLKAWEVGRGAVENSWLTGFPDGWRPCVGPSWYFTLGIRATLTLKYRLGFVTDKI